LGPSEGTRLPLTDFSPPGLFRGPIHIDSQDALKQLLLYIPDIAALQPRSPVLERLWAEGLRSLISVPLIVEEEISGVLSISAIHPAAFTSEHQTIAYEVAGQLGIALHQARLYAQVRCYAAELEQHVAERTAELRESEERYRGLVESATDAIFTLSLDGTITSLNPAFETLFGLSPSEWIGKPFAPLVHPDDVSSTLETIQLVLQGEIAAAKEVRVLSQSGVYVAVEAAAVLQRKSGNVVGILGIARDITQRKQAEEALRHQTALYESLLKAQSDLREGVVIAEGERIIYVNDALCELLGRSAAEILALPSFM